jgi:NDP-sugar pyrophosphorylase family protein
MLQQYSILHLPILDDEHRVVGLVTHAEFMPGAGLELQAVVMAGGFGTRLHPLTSQTPKPMLTMGDRPLMAITIEQLRDAGIRQVQVATHHLADEITSYFGDGSSFGVELSYINEERPLGTAGGLGAISGAETILVVNGDILTQVNYRAMLAYHREHDAVLTVGVRQYDVDVPYGVVECEGPKVRRLAEKPKLNFFVNAGIYLIEPDARRCIPPGQRLDMTDLITRLVEDQRTVISFPIREYWLDIGRPDDYAEGLREVRTWSQRLNRVAMGRG